MTHVQSDDHKQVAEDFRNRKFNQLSARDWALIVKSLLREDAEMIASYSRTELPQHYQSLANLRIGYFGNSRDSNGPLVDTINVLKDLLPATSRAAMAVGVTMASIEFLEGFRNGEEGAEDLLFNVLSIENFVSGFLSGAIAEEIALERRLQPQTRLLVIQNLPGRPFGMSVTGKCWGSIQEEVPQHPMFAASVMRHHDIDNYDIRQALRVPLLFRPEESDIRTLAMIAYAFRNLFSNHPGWEKDAHVLSRYPDWAVRLLKEEIWPSLLNGPNAEQLDALLPQR